MITNFEIHNFRGIRLLKLEDIKSLNLLLGYNNCGKSSVLEALYLFCDPSHPVNDIQINRARHYLRADARSLQYLFYGLDDSSLIVLDGNMDNGEKRSVEVKYYETERTHSDLDNLHLTNRDVNKTYGLRNVLRQTINGIEKTYNFKVEPRDDNSAQTFSEKDKKDYANMVSSGYMPPSSNPLNYIDSFKEIIENKETDNIVNALREIEPTLIGLNIIDDQIMADIGQQKLIPIQLFEDLLKGLYEKLPAHSCITFDMGYVNYKAWQEFSDHDITYVTREKKKSKYKVLETRAVLDEDKDAIISDEVVELSWRRRWQRPMTKEELSHRRGRRPANGVVLVNESESGKHKCRRITKWKDNKDEGTITFITNDMENAASTICEVYRRRWQIERLYRRLKQNFSLKYFLGDNQNAIQIQIWVSMIAWLLMLVIKKQVKRKWSLSNLMTAVHIQINSYIGLYDFLNVPEAQWVRVVERRRKILDESWANTLFGDMRGGNLENQRSITHLQQVTEGEL